MNRINLVLPAAGLGSRFRDVGELRPKPLIPVFGLPMIIWVLLNFPLRSEDKVWIISQTKDCLPDAIRPFSSTLPFEVEFLEIDGLTEGPASTVNLVLKNLPDVDGLIVANTDQYVFADLSPFVDLVRSNSCAGQILTMHASSNAWSYVGRDSNGKIDRVIEKVEISNEATVGVYGWATVALAKGAFKDTFQRNIRTNNEFYVAPTYNHLIGQGLKVETCLVGDHGKAVHGLGTPVDLETFLKNPEAESIVKRYKHELGVGDS
jgi:NDP-sugar pyrophosphorylase family protein